ncbi:MAG TPA: hypothetical protein VFL36_11680 [Myxococcales bacterium]|nr:hypothetical protein [Myxococcales bacterium]
MSARRLAALPLVAAAAALLPGHSPYRQWYAYRAQHLVIVTDGARPGAPELASAVAAAVAAYRPETRAVPATARSPLEVVKLLVSGQLQVGLLPPSDALAAFEGRGRYAELGKVPLRAVGVAGEDVIVALDGFAAERACTIAKALRKSPARGPLANRGHAPPIPLHSGLAGCRGG